MRESGQSRKIGKIERDYLLYLLTIKGRSQRTVDGYAIDLRTFFRFMKLHRGQVDVYKRQGYYWYVGRVDDIIKSSGYRIGPFEIESVLMEHPAVLECGITGVPDEVRGQVIKATIVLTSAYQPSDELAKELQDFVKKATAPYKYPRIVEFVDELPKTISGKIRRIDIRGGEV